MAKTEIPEWLDYRGQGEIPIFWARGKFPVVALAFVFDKMKYQAVGLHLFIDGEHVHVHSQRIFTVAEDHVLLCDLRVLFSDEEWERLDARVGHDNGWKRVQVKCESTMFLRRWGVYAYKTKTNMDDIQFACSYPMLLSQREISVLTTPTSGDGDGDEDEDEEEEEEELERTSIKNDDFSHGCSAILSAFKKLFCGVFVRSRIQEDPWFIHLYSGRKKEAQPPPRPSPLKEEEILYTYDEYEQCFSFEDADSADAEYQGRTSFSESLQTLVENLNRFAVVAPKQEKGSGSKLGNGDHDDNDYILPLLAENMILRDDEEEEPDRKAYHIE